MSFFISFISIITTTKDDHQIKPLIQPLKCAIQFCYSSTLLDQHQEEKFQLQSYDEKKECQRGRETARLEEDHVQHVTLDANEVGNGRREKGFAVVGVLGDEGAQLQVLLVETGEVEHGNILLFSILLVIENLLI